jgi:C9orf72-like protein family
MLQSSSLARREPDRRRRRDGRRHRALIDDFEESASSRSVHRSASSYSLRKGKEATSRHASTHYVGDGERPSAAATSVSGMQRRTSMRFRSTDSAALVGDGGQQKRASSYSSGSSSSSADDSADDALLARANLVDGGASSDSDVGYGGGVVVLPKRAATPSSRRRRRSASSMAASMPNVSLAQASAADRSASMTPSPPASPSVSRHRDAPSMRFQVCPGVGGGLIMLETTFSAPYDTADASGNKLPTLGDGAAPSATRFSLVLLVASKHLKRYMVMRHIVEERVLRLTEKIRALLVLHPASMAVDVFSQLVATFSARLEPLFHSRLPRSLSFRNTMFAARSSLPRLSRFLALAITSHLQSHCASLVIGSSVSAVNRMVDTLALFLTPDERRRSAHVRVGDRQANASTMRPGAERYTPDLMVQGLICQHVEDDELVQSMLPSTVINVDQMSVRQTHLYHDFVMLRDDLLQIEIEHLMMARRRRRANPKTPPRDAATADISSSSHLIVDAAVLEPPSPQQPRHLEPPSPDSPRRRRARSSARRALFTESSDAPPPPPLPLATSSASEDNLFSSSHEGLLRPVKLAAPLVIDMVQSLIVLPLSLREGFIVEFKASLAHRAAILIAYTERERMRSDGGILDVSTIRRVRADLNLDSNADFAMLLSVADRFQPGIYSVMAGDLQAIEAKFSELFE